jgi:hypothetical protein
MDLWAACGERIAPTPLGGNLLRIVESREQVATSALVDDLGEQALLEGMLECIKPLLPAGTEGLHTLLAAPFRYPPLRHGSHFGSRLEPSLFHGSQRLTTLLAEAAYYRFVFWTGMSAPPPSGRLLTQHTVRGARYRTQRGLRLQQPPCAERTPILLTHPSDYGPTQQLGRALREAGIGAFEYLSARDGAGGINAALFEPNALLSRKPSFMQLWLCETRGETVRFSTTADAALHLFPREAFLVTGQLPRPAA